MKYLDIECSIEAHLQEILVVLAEDAQEALFKDRRGKRVGEHNDSIGRVRHRFHFQ